MWNSNKYFSIKAKGKQTAEILIYEQIGKDYWDDSGIGAKQFAEELKALGDLGKIILRINSPGGSVFEGLAIYNTLMTHSAEKEVHIDGLAASIASVIAMVGDPTIMPENALLMIHDPTGLVMGDADDMRKTKLSNNQIADLMKAETWMSAAEAVNYGFANRVEEPVRIAAHVNFDFSIFKNVPNKLKNFGGYKKVETTDKDKDVNDRIYRKDLYREKERVQEILALGKTFNEMDLATKYVEDDGTPEGLKGEILARMQQKANSNIFIPDDKRKRSSGPFKNFGDFLMAVKDAGTPGKQADARLFYNVASGASEAIPSEGGFLVQQEFSADLLQRAYEVGQLASRCRKFSIGPGANGLKINAIDESSRATGSRLGGVQVYWANEADTVTAKKPKFRQMNLVLNKLRGICYATDELLQDSMALQSVILDAFAQEMAFTLDDCILRGTGAGQPIGILNSDALVTISKETGQLADTIVAENVINMYSRMPAWNKGKAVWLLNSECMPQIMQMSLVLGTTSIPLFIQPGGLSALPFGTIFGKPVLEIEQASALGDLGDISFVDLNEYLIIDKGGINADSSMHVRFIYDEMTFRFTFRVDGQPIWNKPLTPYKGANDKSPFVTLEAR